MRIKGLNVASKHERRLEKRTLKSGKLYVTSITRGFSRLADPTGRVASRSYSVGRHARLSDAAKVAHDWNLVGETFSKSVSRERFVDACSKRRD